MNIRTKLAVAFTGAVVAVGVGSPPAHADDDSYLNQLSQHGFQVMWQSQPFLLNAGHGMCNDLQAGQSPEEVASHWNYPTATHQNLVDMASAAKANLCP